MSDHAPAAPAAEGDAAAAPKGGKIPLIAAIVVGLAVGAGSGAAVVGPIVVKKMGFTAPAALPPADAAEGGHGEAASEEGGHGKSEEAPAGEHGKEGAGAAAPPVLLLENLVLNPASSGGQRYLLMSIAIEASDAKVVADLTARDAELKDLILTTLGKKTVEELSEISGREAIKTELVDTLKERFGKKSVKTLYFPQFVIQ